MTRLIRDATNTNQVVRWFLEERGNRSTRRKPLGAEQRTCKLNSHMTPDLGIEPGPHWWEASALTTAPSLHPIEVKIIVLENDPVNIHLFEAFYMRKNKRTLNSRKECIDLLPYCSDASLCTYPFTATLARYCILTPSCLFARPSRTILFHLILP